MANVLADRGVRMEKPCPWGKMHYKGGSGQLAANLRQSHPVSGSRGDYLWRTCRISVGVVFVTRLNMWQK